ncbi:MAG: EAL domain-containing protein [Magnetococcales bacterium]|nr:EAL domain-containing protein [Magnetococcales bacterium]
MAYQANAPVKPLVFVVDDDPVSRLMLSRYLVRHGYEVVEAEHGGVALAAFDRRPADMVLLDARMPVLDGFQTCLEIKNRPEGKLVPVIIITGLDDEESVDRAFEVGATDYITKPIHWAILRNRMSYLLKATRSEQALFLAASVFENIAEGIVVTDAVGVIQSANPAFVKITGYSVDEAVGRRTSLLKSGQHDAAFYKKMWLSLLENGRWQGEIVNRRRNGEIYPQWMTISAILGPDERVRNYVAVFSDLTNLKQSEEHLLYLEGHDTLTSLPNRVLFHERLHQTLAEAKSLDRMAAVLLLDLDRFKVINDTIGHDMGDRLLLMVAERLASCIPAHGVLGRLGGDEFAVICPRLQDPREAAELARRMLTALARVIEIDGLELFVTPSIGISLYPLDGKDGKTLLKNADAAMYHAKEQGRNNFQYYRNEFNASSLARMLLESHLRNALDREQFILYYQPQIHLATGRMVGAEALIRWRHPERGMVSPAEFIPLAEETGLILAMGRWALQTACYQAMAWQAAGAPPIRIAVNLSGLQFKQRDFTELVAQVLEETGLDPQYLELELTESIAMGDVEDTLEKLNALARMGIQLAIDDFGTGFSSLSYLKRYPIHVLKIDRSFIRECTDDPEDAAIVRTVIALAHSMGLKVIAEGVETEAQRELLQRNHCDEFQGYLFSTPVPPESFFPLLGQWANPPHPEPARSR